MKRFFTSESVTEGHPDKLCDRIADSILDELLRQDHTARSAVECCAAYNTLFLTGEVSANAKVNYEKVARKVIREVGYDFGEFSSENCEVIELIHGQSADIARGVDSSAENRDNSADVFDKVGAGDQGMMFGYACRETEELMPLPIVLAHKLARQLTKLRKEGVLEYLRPDGKTQVTVEYDGKMPVRVDAVVVSTQHKDGVSQEKIAADIKKLVIEAVIPKWLLLDTKYLINPTGNFVIGGPEGDSGLTGRKIVVDTYGGRCAHGGGAFSGKDPTKVDRSAAYMARYICKNVVAAGLADEMELQVAYAIGVAHPVSVFVNTFGSGKLSDDLLADIVTKEFDLRPAAIIDTLKLRRPIYAETSAYGHFGRKGFPWEICDRAEDLKKYL